MKRAILFLVILVGLSCLALGSINDGINSCWSLDTSTYNTTHFSNSVGTNSVKLFNTPIATSNNCNIGECVQTNYSFSNTDYLKSMDNMNISGISARTINLWLRPTRAGMATNEKIVVHGNSGEGFGILRINGGNSFYFWADTAGSDDSGTTIPKDNWQMYTISYDGINARSWVNGTLAPSGVASFTLNTGVDVMYFPFSGDEEGYEGYIDEVMMWGRNLTGAEILDLYTNTRNCNYVIGTPTAPVLSNINCTSCGAQGDTVVPYSTTDTTPSFTFVTDMQSSCRVGDDSQDYSTMGGTRNCTSGDGTTSHTCTLTAQDTLVTATDYVYVACANPLNGNSSTTELVVDLNALTDGDEIDDGIQSSSIWPGATIYTDQKVYLRDLNNNQVLATVDRVAVYGNQRWIINHDSSAALGLFNITPVVYTLDMVNIPLTEIESKVSELINATKS